MFSDMAVCKLFSAVIAICLTTACPADPLQQDDLFLHTYLEDQQENEWFTVRTYYYDSPVDYCSVAIGCSFGPEIEDYALDADGDGNSDILCNCIYGGDGVEELLVICKHGSEILYGYADPDKLNLPDWNDYGSGALRTRYDPVQQKIAVTYASGKDPIHWETVYMDFSVVTYREVLSLKGIRQ